MTDPYIYPNGTLKNKLGLKNSDQLWRYEYCETVAQGNALEQNPIKGNFSINHLQQIHKHFFQNVYDWAGEFRTVEIMKATILFFSPKEFGQRVSNFENMMTEHNNLKGLNKNDFVVGLTLCFTHLNALHPFREGNGRATKFFLRQLAEEAGYDLNLTKIDRENWNLASSEAVLGQRGTMERIFDNSIRPRHALSCHYQYDDDTRPTSTTP